MTRGGRIGDRRTQLRGHDDPATGTGTGHLAVSLLNGTATGIGASLGLSDAMHATWTWTDGPGSCHGAPDRRLVDAVADLAPRRAGRRRAAVHIQDAWPPARGLKSSSAAAAALTKAAYGLQDEALLHASIAASRHAGVTLTGALDDQCATVWGGAHLCDNLHGRVLACLPVPDYHVAVWTPDQGVPKRRVAGLDLSLALPGARQAEAHLRRGELAAAITANHAAYAPVYADHFDATPVRDALSAGAVAAGLSGTGPAVAALYADDPPAMVSDGGTWSTHRIRPCRRHGRPR